MFNWLTRNAISSVKAIRKSFSADNIYPKTPTKISACIEDYETILDGHILTVDKSLLIKDIIQHETVLITRPRRWGKSLALKMLQSFFQPKFSPKGDIINDDEKKEKFRKLNIGNKHLTWNPITHKNEKTQIIDLQGSLPVITLTFEDIHECATTKNIIECFRNVLLQGIDPHKYLFTSKKIQDKYSQELLKKYFSEAKHHLTEHDITYTLRALIQSLNEHHNKKVILLVDEYDKTLIEIKLNNPDLYKYACSLYRKLFSIVKNKTEIVQLSVFTGVNQIVNYDIFSVINNIFHDSIISPRTAKDGDEHFGFTETEIEKLIKKAKKISKVKLDENEIKEKLTWLYHGYGINGRLVYNPFSVMNCLHDLVYNKPAYMNYWTKIGDSILFTNAVKEQKKLKEIEESKLNEKEDKTQNKFKFSEENQIEKLIKTGEVNFSPDYQINFDRILTNENSLLTLMLDEGYITPADEKSVYRIPNNEVRHKFFSTICDTWFSEKEMIIIKKSIKINEFEDPEIFIKLFQERILDNLKNEHYPEFFFQALLYACVENAFGALEYRAKDNKKIDIILKSPNDKTTVYIIEIIKKDSNSNKTLINEGLEQILEKRYPESIINDYKEFKTIVLRVVYFEKEQLSKWKINMAELKFTRDNLKRAIECFVPKTIPAQTSQKVKTSKKAKRKEVEIKEVESREVQSRKVLNNDNLFEELTKFASSYFPRENN